MTTLTATTGSAVTAGNLLVIAACGYHPGTMSIGDTVNSYTAGTVGAISGYDAVNFWYCTAATSVALTVTLTTTTSTYLGLAVSEWSYSGNYTFNSQAWNSGTSIAAQSGSLTLGSGNNLVLGIVTNQTNDNPPSAGSGYTAGFRSLNGNEPLLFEYALNVTSGPVTPTATIIAADTWSFMGLSFLEVPSGSLLLPYPTTYRPPFTPHWT